QKKELSKKNLAKQNNNPLLEKVLLHELQIESSQNLTILYTPKGKPYLKDYPSLHFNLSNTASYTAIAIDTTPIGIDIEKVQERPYESLLKRWFTQKESQFVLNHPVSCRLFRFILLWTYKESLLKNIGCGIGAEMKEHEILFRQANSIRDTSSISKENQEVFALYKNIEHNFFSKIITSQQVLKTSPLSALNELENLNKLGEIDEFCRVDELYKANKLKGVESLLEKELFILSLCYTNKESTSPKYPQFFFPKEIPL
ncbi:MAG: 4'-phosphopantetheinyl transferase superfamily protein, partial [Bacteroidales bacterium]